MSLNLVAFPCAREVAVLSLITVLCYSYDKDVSDVRTVVKSLSIRGKTWHEFINGILTMNQSNLEMMQSAKGKPLFSSRDYGRGPEMSIGTYKTNTECLFYSKHESLGCFYIDNLSPQIFSLNTDYFSQALFVRVNRIHGCTKSICTPGMDCH